MATLGNDNINTTECVTRAFFGLVLMEVILLAPLSAAPLPMRKQRQVGGTCRQNACMPAGLTVGITRVY